MPEPSSTDIFPSVARMVYPDKVVDAAFDSYDVIVTKWRDGATFVDVEDELGGSMTVNLSDVIAVIQMSSEARHAAAQRIEEIALRYPNYY